VGGGLRKKGNGTEETVEYLVEASANAQGVVMHRVRENNASEMKRGGETLER